MDKKILTTALILGLSSVVLGAFASHALKGSLDSGAITSFQVGIRYQMYHALLLLFLSQTKFFSNQFKPYIIGKISNHSQKVKLSGNINWL